MDDEDNWISLGTGMYPLGIWFKELLPKEGKEGIVSWEEQAIGKGHKIGAKPSMAVLPSLSPLKSNLMSQISLIYASGNLFE